MKTIRNSDLSPWVTFPLAAIILGLALSLAFGALYFMAWVLQLILVEFGVNVNIWVCLGIWVVIGWIGRCFRGSKD